MPCYKRGGDFSNNVKFATPRDFTLSEQAKSWLRRKDRVKRIGKVVKSTVVLMAVGYLVWAGYLIAKIHYINQYVVAM